MAPVSLLLFLTAVLATIAVCTALAVCLLRDTGVLRARSTRTQFLIRVYNQAGDAWVDLRDDLIARAAAAQTPEELEAVLDDVAVQHNRLAGAVADWTGQPAPEAFS